MNILYEDNHIIIVNKAAGEIVQGDKTGDRTLCDEVKAYIKEKYAKPGAVFLGIPHRLDRPVSGICVFARTSKALTRLNDMFRKSEVKKTYHAIVGNCPKLPEAELVHYLTRNEKQNKAYAHEKEVAGSKRAVLDYKVIGQSERYTLVEVNLHTGRPPSDSLPTGSYRLPHQRRSQIWSTALQSRRLYLSARSTH